MRKVITIILLACATGVWAQQSDWRPVSSWPFVYEKFVEAVIYVGTNNSKLRARANVHVGTSSLWYESYGKKLAAKPGTATKVVFPDSTVYYSVENQLCQVLSEDTVNGKVGRLYMAEVLDRPAYEEMVRTSRQSTMSMVDIAPGLEGIASGVADNEGLRDVDTEALPLRNKFYMQYDDELFEVTEGNILKQLPTREERNTYRSFVRSAEILYGSKQSVLTIWKTFFVK